MGAVVVAGKLVQGFTEMAAAHRYARLDYGSQALGNVPGARIHELFHLSAGPVLGAGNGQVHVLRKPLYQPIGLGQGRASLEHQLLAVGRIGQRPQHIRYPVVLFHEGFGQAQLLGRSQQDLAKLRAEVQRHWMFHSRALGRASALRPRR